MQSVKNFLSYFSYSGTIFWPEQNEVKQEQVNYPMIKQVPNDIWKIIFSMVVNQDILNLRIVCKTFCHITTDRVFLKAQITAKKANWISLNQKWLQEKSAELVKRAQINCELERKQEKDFIAYIHIKNGEIVRQPPKNGKEDWKKINIIYEGKKLKIFKELMANQGINKFANSDLGVLDDSNHLIEDLSIIAEVTLLKFIEESQYLWISRHCKDYICIPSAKMDKFFTDKF